VRPNQWWLGAACGLVLGTFAVIGLRAATDTAVARTEHATTAGKLRINQRISQAAVRRSNQALDLLRPLRTSGGNPPSGWAPTALSATVKAQLHTVYRAAVFNTPGQEPVLESKSEGVTALARTPSLPAGGFDLTFANPVNECTFTGSVSTVRGSALTPVFAPFVVWPTLLGASQVRVFVLLATTGAPTDAPFVVTVTCN